MVKTVKARLADIGALIREIHPADTIPGVPQVRPLTRKFQYKTSVMTSFSSRERP